jgi:hypothetical protein
MRGLNFDAMLSPYVPKPGEFEEHRRRSIEEVAHLCGGEEVLGAASFRQGGAAAQDIAGELGDRLGGLGLGFLAKKGTALARKKRAGGLPKRMILAVTPERLLVFDASFQISTSRREREHGQPSEAMVWRRGDVRCAVDRSGSMSTLRIEPLDGGAPATVVGGSSADDPWSLEVMALLDPSASPAEVG